jgi:hypothetical protein
MNTYIVAYCTENYTPGLGRYGNKEVFQCKADNNMHAREQCRNAYPNCVIISSGRVPTLEEANHGNS